MGHTRKETTTLSSIKNRAERGKIDVVKLAFHDHINNAPMFQEVDHENIPNSPETIKARVDYHDPQNYAFIQAEFEV